MHKPPDQAIRSTPRRAQPSLAELQATMGHVAEATRSSLQEGAAKNHAELAQVSSIAGLAADRLEAESGSAAVVAMLREAESAGRLAFLNKHGSEAAYEAVRRKVEAKYRTPGGRWRIVPAK